MDEREREEWDRLEVELRPASGLVGVLQRVTRLLDRATVRLARRGRDGDDQLHEQ